MVTHAATQPYTVVVIVPTGIGASIGGYAGDALPVVRAIAQVADCVITHPNVMNGAALYWNLPNVLYVEGYGLDQFAAGQWGLQPVHHNRVGLLLDAGIETELRWRHLQVADAVRATLGLNLTEYLITDEPLGVELRQAQSGATWGTIARPESLLRAADTLIHQIGADAIAVVARFPDDPGTAMLQHYRQGHGVDPVAGAEAVISHLIVRQFQVPCAHAPALSPLPLDTALSPRAAAEEIAHTFLPCVLVGLSRAPQFVTAPQSNAQTTLWADQVDAVVLPASACGGSALLSLSQQQTQIVAVADNQTQMQVFPQDLGLRAWTVGSYLEALGVLVADRSGISPESLQPQLQQLQAWEPHL
jgi:hypothetical protein